MKKITGFTIIELMMTILVISIITAIAVPSMSSFIKNSRQTSNVNLIVSLINYSRSQAVGLNSVVSLCASDDGTSCNTNKWEAGGLIFTGIATTSYTPAAADILKVIEPQSNGTTLRRISSAAITPTGFDASFIRFEPTGRMYSEDAGAFTLCDDRKESHARGVIVNASGQARTAKDSDANGVVEIVYNGALTAVQCP